MAGKAYRRGEVLYFAMPEHRNPAVVARHLDAHESIVASELPTAGHRILAGDLSYTREGSGGCKLCGS